MMRHRTKKGRYIPRGQTSLRRKCGQGRCHMAILMAIVVAGVGITAVSAGDILRGGARPSTVGGHGNTPPQAPTGAAPQSPANDSLARTARAVQEVHQMQTAARAAAESQRPNPNQPGVFLPHVPDGLLSGGLQVAPGIAENPSLWQGADLPSQAVADARVNVSVRQTASQALLTWRSFNIGKDTSLHFDQSLGGAEQSSWTVFNQVQDPSGLPSQILGSMTAPGQVFVISPNGILFGSNSQVNLRGLTASSLPINQNLVERGLLNNPDSQFLFSALNLPAGPNGTPAFQAPAFPEGLSRPGDVLVEAGARIAASSSAEGGGGRIMLVGPNVKNEGAVSTPDGQTILAAGLQVGIAAHASDDPSLRGLDVYVGAVSGAGISGDQVGAATNNGLISVQRGNLTMTGKSVNQLGVIDSSTSVALNGRIDLLASYGALSNPALGTGGSGTAARPFLYQNTGLVRFGDGSALRILPEWESDRKVVGTELALKSQVNIRGHSVYLGEDSTLYAPNARVNVDAGEWRYRNLPTPASDFVTSKGQVYIDRGAVIDVSGSAGVEAPMSRHFVTVDLRGSELADSPLQRLGALRGQSLIVDTRVKGEFNGYEWVGTPLANVSGYLNLVERTVGELTVDGGAVNISAGDAIVAREGSRIDVSGGWIDYQEGSVQASRLISGGNVIELGDARPDLVYDGIFSGRAESHHDRWGMVQSFSSPLAPAGKPVEPGYRHGADGGSLKLGAAAMALDGALVGKSAAGERQRADQPMPSSLDLRFVKQDGNIAPVFPISAPTPPRVLFGESLSLAPPEPFALDTDGKPVPLAAERTGLVELSPGLLDETNFGRLLVFNPDGDIEIPEGVVIHRASGGELALTGSNVRLDGEIVLPGGDVSMTARNISLERINALEQTANKVNPVPAADRGNVFLGSNAIIDVAGRTIDERSGVGTQAGPLVTRGGRVSISGYNSILEEGSLVDASGGMHATEKGRFVYGNGGMISVEAGRDPVLSSVLGGRLDLDAEVRGFSGGRGGELRVLAPMVQVGGEAAPELAFHVDSGFFNEGGFAKFTLRGIGAAADGVETYVPGALVVGGAQLAPRVTSLIASPAGPDGSLVLEQLLREDGTRLPVDLSFGAVGAIDPYANTLLVRGDVALEEGAVLDLDPRAKAQFSGDTVSIYGSVIAPGGEIVVSGAPVLPAVSPDLARALPTVHIGETARISTAGVEVLRENPFNLRFGEVLSGGRIAVSGNILAEAGSVLNASGATGVLDLAPAAIPGVRGAAESLQGRLYVPARVNSGGGQISLSGSSLLLTDATLLGSAGGEGASGGSLTIGSGRFYQDAEIRTTADVNLTGSQQDAGFSIDGRPAGIGQTVFDAEGKVITGGGRFAVDQFASSGMDHLELRGNVRFEGPVEVSAEGSLRVATGGVIEATDRVVLDAPYVGLGQAFRAPVEPGRQPLLFTQEIPGTGQREYYFSPVHGAGELNVNAGQIDVGTLSLQQIGHAHLTATDGSVRGNGYMNLAGDLRIDAGQVHPTTAGQFTITSFDYTFDDGIRPGTIRIGQAGSASLPWAAGGDLSIYASFIEQGGTLRSPLGTIHLGHDGTATPLNPVTGGIAPAAQTVRLAPGSLTSVSAVHTESGQGFMLPYGTVLNGVSWFDPRGVNITNAGPVAKSVQIEASETEAAEGAVIDLRGGGDLFAYLWQPGLGGSRDILAGSTGFAIAPAFEGNFAPYAPYNPNPESGSFDGDRGYTFDGYRPGERIFIEGAGDLPGGYYTLLPARYALLPGAFLVTPQAGEAGPGRVRPDGSLLVSGHRLSGLNESSEGKINLRFEALPAKVVRERSEYTEYFGNEFFMDVAEKRGLAAPRLPIDAGQLALSATQAMVLNGQVVASVPSGGRGSQVDISSPGSLVIGAPGMVAPEGMLMLDASSLSAFGADSLLIGGKRKSADGVQSIEVRTSELRLDNQESVLSGPDVILAAKERITLAEGSSIRATGEIVDDPDALRIGDISQAGSGDGVLVRVSAADDIRVDRVEVSDSTTPTLAVEAGAFVGGRSAILDSSRATSLSPDAIFGVDNIEFASGRISLVLDEVVEPGEGAGLVFAGDALDSLLGSTRRLSLASYGTIDLLGSGRIGSADFEDLRFRTDALRGDGGATQTVEIVAQSVLFGNMAESSVAAPVSSPGGELRVDAGRLELSHKETAIAGFGKVSLQATEELRLTGRGGLNVDGRLAVETPRVVAERGADQAIRAGEEFSLRGGDPESKAHQAGVGARFAVEGSSVALDTKVSLPAGAFSAVAREGDLTVEGGRIDVGGINQAFFDQHRFIDAGSISLKAMEGSIVVDPDAALLLSAHAHGGEAGSLDLSAGGGTIRLDGLVVARGGAGGTVEMDMGNVPGGSLEEMDTLLNEGGFFRERAYRIREGDVVLDGIALAANYRVTADSGSILARGKIDASGKTGGQIALRAAQNLILEEDAYLTVAAEAFDSAGKGGRVTLEAGAPVDGAVDPEAWLDVRAGSTIDLSVAEKSGQSAGRGQFSGVLHLRAPRTASGDDLLLAPIGGTLVQPSHIVAEGVRLYDLTETNGTITPSVQTAVRNDGIAFLGGAGQTTAHYLAMRDRILGLQPELENKIIFMPGAEIVNRTGDLILGASNSTASSDWNLASFRFGPSHAPGMLTLRAAGDLVFYNALSDGFAGGTSLWLSPLIGYNNLLPANAQSWSFRLTAGGDHSAADAGTTLSADKLAEDKGSLLLGKNAGAAIAQGGNNATTASIIGERFQVIRTGSGDIDINAGRDVLLLNPFASIYTAGTAVPTATSLFGDNDFSLPVLFRPGPAISQGALGAGQQVYPVQYTLAGGNVSIFSGNDIARYTRDGSGRLVPDSSRQLPNNWLYRRGYVDPAGRFGATQLGSGFTGLTDPDSSTTWWIDFSNFFQSVGALGGGHVSLLAGNHVTNIDAVIPTNARMPKGLPDASRLVELGGGDLRVLAGGNIDAGVFYVERGAGMLRAGSDITTNATRSPSLGIIRSFSNPPRQPAEAWLPTTLFVGKGNFDVGAKGDVLLGPVTNPFFLPQGLNNQFWFKTYFQTFDSATSLDVFSLNGDITLRNAVTLTDTTVAQPALLVWLQRQNSLTTGNSAAFYQPWLRLAESSVEPFRTMASLGPSSLHATSFGGDIRLAGSFNLFPSPTGSLEVLSAGAIDALQPTGLSDRIQPGSRLRSWSASQLNLSDADPARFPGVANPFAYYGLAGSSITANNQTMVGFLHPLNRLFAETGATNTVLQTKQALHSPGLLHRNDDRPVVLYATEGNISGLRLFTPKPARIVAGQDISDNDFYIQNIKTGDVSLVAAGRDILAYNPNSVLRNQAVAFGNALNLGQQPRGGDIQISGPGTLEILAGRNLDLGIGPNQPDGTARGIASVGNVRNPALPARGADLVVGAGVGPALGLHSGGMDIDGFIESFLNPQTSEHGSRFLPELAKRLGGGDDVWERFLGLAEDEKAHLALELFYRALRDTGRDYNDPDAFGFGNYDMGFAAIEALYPGKQWSGDILLTSRQIVTAAGGDISLFAPGGELFVGFNVPGTSPDQGILTQDGGNISIYTNGSVVVGTSRIFTLRGGDVLIWSSEGDIAAGSAAKTVQSAPPTRVIVNPQTAVVETDLAGLSTGGGIGVLQTVASVPPGDVDLIAPTGTIDAGDAGIRVSGNLNIAAVQVVNAGNIQAGGASTGVPVAPSAGANVGSLTAASAATAASTSAADHARQRQNRGVQGTETASIFTVEVIGYGDGKIDKEDDEIGI